MNRRSFLKWLGLGAVAAPVAVKVAAKALKPAAKVGIDLAKGPDLTAGSLHFMGVPVIPVNTMPSNEIYMLDRRLMEEMSKKLADDVFYRSCNPPVYVGQDAYVKICKLTGLET